MTIPADAAPAPRPKPWGLLMTAAWTVATVISIAVASFVAMALWFPDAMENTSEFVGDARAFGILFIVTVAAETAVLVAAARLAGWPATDYLALRWPDRREAMIAVAAVVLFALAFDAFTYLVGKDVVTPFQLELYKNAAASNSLPLMWLTLVVVAPVGEEIMFRGFLYRGWAQTPRAVVPAIVVISAFWAIIHTQYDWFGVSQVFLIGLVLGWVRWRSGSTPLTIGLHGLMNAWATLQTFVKVNWL